MEKYTSSHSSYSGDIYTKGAYFMHSLRYALGDSIFFNTLYEFIEDSSYTYQNFVETEVSIRIKLDFEAEEVLILEIKF